MTKTKKITTSLAGIIISCGLIVIMAFGFTGCFYYYPDLTVPDYEWGQENPWAYIANNDIRNNTTTYTLTGLVSDSICGNVILPTCHMRYITNGKGLKVTNTLSYGYTRVNTRAFEGYEGFVRLEIRKTYMTLEEYAFYGCSNLSEVTIESEKIGGYCFGACESLSSIWFGSALTFIGDYAFDGCDSITEIYYEGTRDDWADVYIGVGNECFSSDCFRYYSEEEPTDDGYSYWHYINGMVVNW